MGSVFVFQCVGAYLHTGATDTRFDPQLFFVLLILLVEVVFVAESRAHQF